MYSPDVDAIKDRAAAFKASWRPWLRRSVITLIVLMAVYVGIAGWATRGDLAVAVRDFPVSILPSVLGLVSLGLVLRIIRWHYYVRRMRWTVPPHHSVVAFLASLAFTATPGKAGEVVKFVLLRMRHDVPISSGVGVLIVERLSDVIAVLMIVIASLSLSTEATSFLMLVALPIAAGTLFMSNRGMQRSLLVRLARVKGMHEISQRVARSLDACRQLLQPFPFMVGTGLAIIAWSCEALAFYYLVRSVGIEIEPLQASSIYGAATLAGVVSTLPGGLGGFELVMVLLLNRLGILAAVATAPVMVFRLCTLWFGIFLGFVCMLTWMLFFRSYSRYADSTVNGA